jgi:uncharacterized protein YjaZ
MNVHFFDASSRLAEYRTTILEQTELAVSRIQKMLPLGDVDLVLCANETGAIYPGGFGGTAPSADVVILYFDRNSPQFQEQLETRLQATLAHELHHAARHAHPGYGRIMVEALVTEGLAQHFELPFLNGKRPVLSQLKQPERLPELMTLARAEFQHDLATAYVDWFAGNRALNIPTSAGYVIGFELVGQYLEKTGQDAGAAYNVTAQEVLAVLEA